MGIGFIEIETYALNEFSVLDAAHGRRAVTVYVG